MRIPTFCTIIFCIAFLNILNAELKTGSIGPVVTGCYLEKDSLWEGVPFNVDICLSDSFSPTPSIISGAEYFIDNIGASGSGLKLTAKFGQFDSVIKIASCKIKTDSLSYGFHKLFFHGIDSSGSWGDFYKDSIFILNYPGNCSYWGYNQQHTNFNAVDSIKLPMKMKWSKSMGTLESPVIVANDLIYLSLGNGSGLPQYPCEVYALNKKDGKEMWSRSFGSIYSIDCPAFADGMVYVRTCDNYSNSYVTAYDALSGLIKWSSHYLTQWENSDGPIVVGGKVFIKGGEYGGMYAFDAFSGTQLWFTSLKQIFGSWSPAYYNGSVFACYDGSSYVKLSAASGALQYTFGTPGNYGYTPVISNGRILTNNPVTSIDLSANTNIWSKSSSNPIAVAYGKTFVLNAGILKVYDELTGQFLWDFSGNNKLNYNPVVSNGYVFVSSDSAIFAVNINTMAQEWSTDLTGGYLTIANGNLYSSSIKTGKLFAFETGLASINDNKPEIPSAYNLFQNYPNPFNPATKIKYSLPVESNVKISVFNSIGQLIKEFIPGTEKSGEHEFNFEAFKLASGVIFYSLEANSIDGKQTFRNTKKMILMK